MRLGATPQPQRSSQLFQQRLRLLHIGSVEPLGELAVDGGEQVVDSVVEPPGARIAGATEQECAPEPKQLDLPPRSLATSTCASPVSTARARRRTGPVSLRLLSSGLGQGNAPVGGYPSAIFGD